jgi:hypothetical protein
MWAWLFWWRPPCVLRTVIVNLKEDPNAFRAVLWSVRGPWLTFKDCTLLRASGDTTRVDGEVVIHRDNVSFLQALPWRPL